MRSNVSVLLLSFAAMFTIATPVSAVILVEESFDYAAGGTAFGTGSATNNWAGSWFPGNANGMDSDNAIVSGSLTYVDSGGRSLVTSGNHYENVTPDSANGRIYRNIDTSALAASADPEVQALMFDNSPLNPGTDYRIGKAGSTVWISYLSHFADNINFGGLEPQSTGGAEATSGNGNAIPVVSDTFVAGPGDFDNDNDVDGNDFLIWQRGESPNSGSAEDLAEWQANYGTVGGGGYEPLGVIFDHDPDAGVQFNAGLRSYTTRSSFGSTSSADGPYYRMQAHRNGDSSVIPGFGDFTEVDPTTAPNGSSTANLVVVRIDFIGDPTGVDANGNWNEYPWYDPETQLFDQNEANGGVGAYDHPDADKIYMWVNPELDTEPSIDDAMNNVNGGAFIRYWADFQRKGFLYLDRFDFKFDSFGLGARSDAGSAFDELRMGTTYGDVAPYTDQLVAGQVPEPTTLILLAFASAGVLASTPRR